MIASLQVYTAMQEFQLNPIYVNRGFCEGEGGWANGDEDDIGGRFGSPRLGELALLRGYQCKYTIRYDQPGLNLIIYAQKNSIFHACIFVS